MKNNVYVVNLLISLLVLSSCGVSEKNYNIVLGEKEQLQAECDSLKNALVLSNNEILALRDSVKIYMYPADQRYNAILAAIKEKKYQIAKLEIKALKSTFPHSKEALECERQNEFIDKMIVAQKAEEERVRALGFKALKANSTMKIDYNTITISGISIGATFTFDSYGDRYFYREADRGNRYVTARMQVYSTSKNPNLPQLAIYTINGDIMKYVDSFVTRYARWEDYASYLGNEADYRNDFSKTSTIPFKIGVEIDSKITKSAFAIVIKNQNVLIEQYNRFDNPPKSWTGHAGFASTLSMDDFKNDYTMIKIFNL